MKEIDGLIACSHYGVIEWLCTYDQTVSADVARKQSDWSIPDGRGMGGAEPMALGTPILSPVSALCRCPGATSSSEGKQRGLRVPPAAPRHPNLSLANAAPTWGVGHGDQVL